MTDPAVYLEKLSAFSRMLRLEGLSVSPKETADAGQILISLGMDNRERVKTALRTVYAKSREEQLPLGKDGVESERTFTATRKPRKYREFVPWYGYVDIF